MTATYGSNTPGFWDWFDRVPEDVAIRQRGWERNHRVLRAFEAGCPQRVIATAMSLSKGRVGQIIAKARRTPVSPVERYWGGPLDLSPYGKRVCREFLDKQPLGE